MQAIRHRAIVFVISDFADFSDETKKVLALLARKADVSCVNVFDILEKYPPEAGEYMVWQGGRQLVFSSQGQVFRQEYIKYFAQKHRRVKDFCHKFQLHYLEAGTEIR